MKITRETAIQIIDRLSDQDHIWDNLMENYDLYDEESDTNPSIFDLFEALGVSRNEVTNVLGMNKKAVWGEESGGEWYTANVDTEKRDAAAFTIMPKVYEKYIEHAEKEGYDEDWPEAIASDSYRIAEAMMKERKVRHD